MKTVLEGKMERKRTRGKPRRKMLDLYSWSKRTRRSVTRSWREELNTGSSGTIINWTCFRAEHTRRISHHVLR